jgi:ubiquinone/menaquinone biosynthesis C-methylase UbiE
MINAFQFRKYSKRTVLDLGCGAGIDSAEFLKSGARTVSLDFSLLSARSAKLLLKEARLKGNVVLGDARYLPFRDAQFDIVYSFGVIHHIPNVSNALREIVRILRPEGVFMGMVYNRNSLLYAYSILYLHGILEGLFSQGESEIDVASRFSERIIGNPYTKPYDKDELMNMLERFFKSVKVRTCYNVIDTPQKRKVKFTLENNSGELGWHLVFKSKK